jgi:hypothetical protein
VVAKRKQKSKKTIKLETAKQEGKLKPPRSKHTSNPNMPKKQMRDKFAWEKKPLATFHCCGINGHVVNDCYSRMREDTIQWRQIPYHKPGNKPLTRKEQQRIQLMEDHF